MHKCISDMDIEITDKTRTRDILPFLTTSNITEVCKQVDVVPIDPPIPEMTVDDFNELLSSPENYMMKLAKKHRGALQFLGACRDMFDQLEGFTKFIKQFEVKQSGEEKQAANGVPFPSFGNYMVSTLVKFYNLHGVDEAANKRVKEFMLAFEVESSTAMFSRRYSEITAKKAKIKKK